MSAARIFLGSFKRGFRGFGMNVSVVIGYVLLAVVYFVGIGATSVIGKVFGKKFLDMKPRGETYWTDRAPVKKEELKRMF